ncbi:MAG: NYN domain-containing protein [Anaerolineales bacterium]
MDGNNQLAVFIDFENIALWAEREFFDFEVTSLMEYLQSRGPAVVKRAYGDWSRFSRYRDELMNNSIDLIQIYSVRVGKNRADIRMAIDAFEIAMTRPQINNFVIISGDSDFGPLVGKLREYGRYTLGIGPRSITHHLLVKSCDEFVYLETALGETAEVDEQSSVDRELARGLLAKALQAHGQRGEVPVLATRLKQTMLLMDPAFNEANFGYSQFKAWLEDSRDLVKLFMRDLQLYVAPIDYVAPGDLELIPSEVPQETKETQGSAALTLDVQYRSIFNRLKVASIEMSTRRDVLRDIYRELCEHPGEQTTDELLDNLATVYEAQGLIRSKANLREILQMAYRQESFDYGDKTASLHVPVWLAPGIQSEADFVRRAESDFVYAIVRAGLDIDHEELAYILLNDRNQVEYIQNLLDDLKQRGLITQRAKRYQLAGRGILPFEDDPALKILFRDIQEVEVPENMASGVETAHRLAKKAMVQRSQDFAASADNYLLACRLQWDAFRAGERGVSLEDLRWYMASYASAIAGKLSQVNRDYRGARPYYLAFFALVQEDDPLWSRMRGLINPMLSYFWANAGRELELNTSAWNLSMSSPAQIAVYAATHPNSDLRKLWYSITEELAQVNPGILERIGNQITLSSSDQPENLRVAEQISGILDSLTPA